MGIEHFKMRFKELMNEKGLKPKDIENDVGVSYAVIYRYLREGYYCGLRADTLERIADVFGVSMDDLWRGGE